MSKTGWFIVIVFVAVILGFVWWYNNRQVNPRSIEVNKASFPLHYGQQSEEIRSIQRILNSKFNANIIEDGNWGDSTQAAIWRYFKYDSIDEPRYYKLINDRDYVNLLYQNYLNSPS